MADKGTRVTAQDLDTGDSDSVVIHDDYVIICDGTAQLDQVTKHANGTTVITVTGCKRPAVPGTMRWASDNTAIVSERGAS